MGRSALLVECRDGDEAEAWRAELWQRRADGACDAADIVPGARTVLLHGIDPSLAATIESWTPGSSAATSDFPLVEIHTTFNGEDLSDVADRWG